jgi:hypothetical protein
MSQITDVARIVVNETRHRAEKARRRVAGEPAPTRAEQLRENIAVQRLSKALAVQPGALALAGAALLVGIGVGVALALVAVLATNRRS